MCKLIMKVHTARVTSIWHFTSIMVHISWTHDVIFSTFHWTMIDTVSTFHGHASIRTHLLSSFWVPESWAGHFLWPITINWTKLCKNTKRMKLLIVIYNIHPFFYMQNFQKNTYCHDGNNLNFGIHQDLPFCLDKSYHFHHIWQDIELGSLHFY